MLELPPNQGTEIVKWLYSKFSETRDDIIQFYGLVAKKVSLTKINNSTTSALRALWKALRSVNLVQL